MSTDFQGREPTVTPNTDAPLFAANPVWERSRRKRGMLGGRKSTAPTAAQEPRAAARPAPMASDRVAPDGLSPDRVADEPRSFAAEEPAMILDRPVDRPFAAGTGAAATRPTIAADGPAAAPRDPATRSARTGNAGPSAALIAGGVAAVALVAVGGWYVMAPRDGVPELAPGQATTTEVAAAPLMAAQQPAEVAQSTNTLPERRIAAPVRSEPVQLAQAPRVRPAARAPAVSTTESATESGTNAAAAAVLPDAPQPYNTLNPSAAPAPIGPAPVQAAPVPMPETPPVQTPAAPAPEAPAISPIS